jgi:hypothetical protein
MIYIFYITNLIKVKKFLEIQIEYRYKKAPILNSSFDLYFYFTNLIKVKFKMIFVIKKHQF